MKNIDKLIEKVNGNNIFTSAQIRELFFVGDEGMTLSHLERVTQKINEFITVYKNCKKPLTYLVKTKCGHLEGKTQRTIKRNKILHKCMYIEIDFSVVVDGQDKNGDLRTLLDITNDVMQKAITNSRVLRHEIADVLSLQLESFERALEQFIISAKDPYFRLIDRNTPEHILAVFRYENAHRIVQYTYKNKIGDGARDLFHSKRQRQKKYSRTKKNKAKGKFNPEFYLSPNSIRGKSVDAILRGLEEDGF